MCLNLKHLSRSVISGFIQSSVGGFFCFFPRHAVDFSARPPIFLLDVCSRYATSAVCVRSAEKSSPREHVADTQTLPHLPICKTTGKIH